MFKKVLLTAGALTSMAFGVAVGHEARSSAAELHPSLAPIQIDTFTQSDCFVRIEGDLASSFCANGPGKQRVEVNCTGGGKVEGPWVAVNTNSFVACVTNVASARTAKVSVYVP